MVNVWQIDPRSKCLLTAEIQTLWRMSDEADWADQYNHLRKKYEYAVLGQPVVPVKETDSSGKETIVGFEETDALPETEQSRDEVDAEMRELLSKVLKQEVTEGATYEAQIRHLLNTVECDIRTNRLAAVVGCSKSYVSRFMYDEDCGRVVEKDWSKEYRDEKVSSGTRKRVLRRDNNRCCRCEGTDNLQIHHIVPVSAGGENQDKNLATLCKPCHKLAHGGSWTSRSVVYDEFESWIS